MRATALFLLSLLLLFNYCQPMNTVVVDGLAEWKSPVSLHVGDSLVFKHKHLRNLYLFHNRRAFVLCNFAQAAFIYKGGSTHFTWIPSRSGYYYFSRKDNCEKGEKVLVRVISSPDLSPAFPPLSAPPPTAGGEFSFSPSHGWGWVSSSPSRSPDAAPLVPKEGTPSAPTPASAPETRGGIPFLSSNPAVPLPTGMTDTASIRPLPTQTQVVGLSSSSVRMGRRLLVSVMICSALAVWT